ncbi:uncharacterized protein F5Z01DRAFT_459857 [Emericellopsis atlantica]|uniref:Uncharacterized protein n=1 Tax=Emericellopsis atlantica TaxID=2614577 RepID=A0A9P8CRP5_9HYPO|nr:uncharacterized protein F5Z01DRAFT_459857 [Emericellopsis atlantica]KAG9257234.1 hypothetical protein F5Z01DRAFT_459857 [Emericellopsis atlantica]
MPCKVRKRDIPKKIYHDCRSTGFQPAYLTPGELELSTNYQPRKALPKGPRTFHTPGDKHLASANEQQTSRSSEPSVSRNKVRMSNKGAVSRGWSLLRKKTKSPRSRNGGNEHCPASTLLQEDFEPWLPESSQQAGPSPSRVQHRPLVLHRAPGAWPDVPPPAYESNNEQVDSDSQVAPEFFQAPRLMLTPPTPPPCYGWS